MSSSSNNNFLCTPINLHYLFHLDLKDGVFLSLYLLLQVPEVVLNFFPQSTEDLKGMAGREVRWAPG